MTLIAQAPKKGLSNQTAVSTASWQPCAPTCSLWAIQPHWPFSIGARGRGEPTGPFPFGRRDTPALRPLTSGVPANGRRGAEEFFPPSGALPAFGRLQRRVRRSPRRVPAGSVLRFARRPAGTELCPELRGRPGCWAVKALGGGGSPPPEGAAEAGRAGWLEAGSPRPRGASALRGRKYLRAGSGL